MKKQLTVIAIILLAGFNSFAQEFRLAKSSGQLNLNIYGAIIEGYDGKEIIFSGEKKNNEKVDERAKGLLEISGSGFSDNTGLGISVVENGQEINVNNVSKNKRGNGILTIKVPKNIKITFKNNSSMNYENIIFRGLTNEIEVSTSYNNIKLENNSGPMNVKSMFGSIDASFSGTVNGPISIISLHDNVDVSVPKGIKANVELATSFGNLYASKELNIVTDQSKSTKSASGQQSSAENSSSVNVGYQNGERVKGAINGGGVDLIFKSNYKNVYLRVQ